MSGLRFQPFVEVEGSRRVRLVARRRTGVGPGTQQLDVVPAQAALVREVSERRVGEPRRHLLRDDRALDGLGPRPRLLVGEQRHRRHLAGPVARLAVGLEHRQHVLVERGGVGRPRLSGAGEHRDHDCREQSHRDASSRHGATHEKLAASSVLPWPEYVADLRIRAQGPRAYDLAVHDLRRRNQVGSLPVLDPLLERGQHVERRRTGAAAAVTHSRHHEHPVVVVEGRPAALLRFDGLEEPCAAGRGNLLIGPPVVVNQLAAARAEAAEIGREHVDAPLLDGRHLGHVLVEVQRLVVPGGIVEDHELKHLRAEARAAAGRRTWPSRVRSHARDPERLRCPCAG